MRKFHKAKFMSVSKVTAWLLLLSLLANIANAYVAPKKAQAVDASDYLYLFWPTASDCSDKPSGWTVVSDGAGEEFYDATNGGLFIRGETSYSRNAGGALTHTHTGTGSQTAITGSNSRSTAGTAQNSNTHTHTVTVSSVSNVSTLPQYKELCVIKYDGGIPNGNSAIPNNAVAMFSTDPSAISGWTDYTSTYGSGNFIRGGAKATGGSNTHQGSGHSMSGTMNAASGDIGAYSYATAGMASATTHTHTISGTSDTPDTQPPYREVYLGQKSSAGPIPNGMLAMFNDTDSSVGFTQAGWQRMSDSGGDFYQKFIKVTGSTGTGGATTHTHAAITGTSGSGGGTLTGRSGSGSNIQSHTHGFSVTLADGTNTNIPPYTNIVIAKKETVTTTLSTDKGSYGNSETISVSTTVNNYNASTALNNKYIDAVIFIDANADGVPTAGETYITNGCAGSAAWASGNYTHQNTAVSVAASSSADDNWNCSNTNFPSSTTYTLWVRWWDGTSYAYNIYYDKSVTFSSVPTLSEALFAGLVAGAVYLGVRTGVIKLRFSDSGVKNTPSAPGPFPANPPNSQPESYGVHLSRSKQQRKKLDTNSKRHEQSQNQHET